MPSISRREAAFRRLAAELEVKETVVEEPVEEDHKKRWLAGWRPKRNPTQQLGHDTNAIFILYDGERASGKTTGALHDLVEHCYLNATLGFVIVKEVGQATDGGAWSKLMQEILPCWKYGNRDRDKHLVDSGLGIDYGTGKSGSDENSMLDAQTKKPHVWMRAINGGWSKLMLFSLPVAHQVKSKIKGKEPSFIVVDEAQTLEDGDYFNMIVPQLGRRGGLAGRQKIIFCANPDGPSHWLYKKFFIDPVDPKTREWDGRYARFHVPITENLHNLPDGYYEDYVLPAVKGDKIEEARMVRGEWVDRPRGQALFRDDFSEELHVRGDALEGRGIMPVKGIPIIISYDPGGANTSIHFLQVVPTRDKVYKITLDEMDYVGRYVPYHKLVPEVIQRMQRWEAVTGSPQRWIHVSDDSAFNQYRSKDGSFDCWDIEKLSKEYVERHKLPDRFLIRLRAAPKGANSRAARVRMVRDALQAEEWLVSATCLRTKEMLMNLEQDPEDALAPKPGTVFTHKFDSNTYGFFWATVGRGRFQVQTAEVQPRAYRAGGN